MKKFHRSLFTTAILLAAGGVNAAAFQLAEVSSSGLGRAYAGEAAIADNAAVVATNPALMSLFDANQFSAGGVYVDSKIRMEGQIALQGTALKADAHKSSVVPGSFVPNMYFISPINDKFAVGGGMNVNFGLKSEYEDSYAAGIFGGTTDLTALNLNLSGSYRVTEQFSAGLGINAVYAKAEVERTAGFLAPLMSAPAGTPLVHLQDKNAWGFGWNAGLSYQINERNRFGLAYHSPIDIDFKDHNALSRAAAPRRGGQLTGVGELTLKLPSYWEFSGFHQITDKLALHYSYKYTDWHRFKELRGTYQDGVDAFYKEENYRANSRIAFGATYALNDALTLRAGIAYDEAAATGKHASASIPDTDRTWYSFGATYKFTPDLSIDAGFAHLHGKKIQFTEESSFAGRKVVAQYRSKSSANLYGLNLNYRF